MRHARSWGAAFALALLAACGSSGGGGGTVTTAVQSSPNAHLFQGPYQTVQVSATEGMGFESVRTFWGTLFADGVHDVSGSMTRNAAGVISTTPYASWGTFAVESNRRFTYESMFAGLDHSVGGITETGDLAMLAILSEGSTPTLRVFAKREGAHALASLSGTYRLCGFGATVAGVLTSSTWGTLTFDGAGGGLTQVSQNQEGVIVGPINIPITYTVAPSGETSVTFAGGVTLDGGLGAGGDVVLLGGGTGAGDNGFVYVLVRTSAGLSDADLDGDFVLNGLLQEIGTNFYATIAGNLEADGMGAAEARGMRCHEGTLEWLPTENVTTTVAPTGEMSLTTGGGDLFVGGLAPDARFGVFAGPTNAGSDPGILFILR